MEALTPPDQGDGPSLLLLEPERRRGTRGLAWAGSLLFHAAAIAVVFLIPWTSAGRRGAPQIVARLERPTPLVAPPPELTQKAPNQGKIGKEFDLESLLPRPRVRVPPAAPAPSLPANPAPTPRTAKPAPRSLPEPPPVNASAAHLQPVPPLGSPLAPPPPPQIQPEEKPKLVFETPGAPSGSPRTAGLGVAKIPPPSTSIDEAIRGAARRGPSGGLMVGDVGLASGGIGQGLNLPPRPGRSGTTLEMLSDPQGVDFKPYLIRILATVRRNWLAVIPESARLGRSGRVQIQFAISRQGQVPKLVIAMPSGTDALDRAAVAGISASNPFPPLPTEFRGEQIRLQFTFLYNVPAN